MGDPKKLRKKYQTPSHPWNAKAIEEEKALVQEYGLKKKKEIQIAISFLKKYKDIAKTLIADKTAQGEKEKKQMMEKLHRLGFISADARLDDVLRLELKDILERRIQSQLFRHGFAKSMNQARQFIVHGHIKAGARPVTFPSYLISVEEESQLCFKPTSILANEDHPERISAEAEVQKEIENVMPKTKDQVEEKVEEIEASVQAVEEGEKS